MPYKRFGACAPMVATTTVAEIGDLSRFENPRQLMAYLGLVPSEHSSGKNTKRGGITKTGNGHVRRALVEAAQTYQLPGPGKQGTCSQRQEGLPRERPQDRLESPGAAVRTVPETHGQGKPRNKVVTAIARELSGFMWAIAKEVPMSAA